MKLATVCFQSLRNRLQGSIKFPDALNDAERDACKAPERFWDSANSRSPKLTPGKVVSDVICSLEARDQKDRETCVTFALVAAMELRILRDSKLRLDLSEQYASAMIMRGMGNDPASSDERVRVYDALAVFRDVPICDEQHCSYQLRGSDPSEDARRHARYRIEDYFLIPRLPWSPYPDRFLQPCLDGPGISNTSYLEGILAAGYDIIVAICVTDCGERDADSGIYVTTCNEQASGMSCVPWFAQFSHAIVIHGYVRNAPVPYFVCRDTLRELSQGKPLLVSYDYVRIYAQYGAVITRVGIAPESDADAAGHDCAMSSA